MTGIDRAEQRFDDDGPEFPPWLDLVAPAIGVIGLIAAAIDAGGPVLLSLARILVGAAFLGAVTDAMLLGHWYLVQPGLARDPIEELVDWTGRLWLPELVVLIWPIGMVSVLNGSIDDGYNGLLGWFWIAMRHRHDRPRRRHQLGAARTPVRGRDGGDRVVVPRDPDGVRHGRGRPRTPRRLIGRRRAPTLVNALLAPMRKSTVAHGRGGHDGSGTTAKRHTNSGTDDHPGTTVTPRSRLRRESDEELVARRRGRGTTGLR